MARPTKLNEELLEKARAYIYSTGEEKAKFTDDDSIIPTLEGFASYLSLSRDTVYAWCEPPAKPTEGDPDAWGERAELHKQFSYIVNEIKNQQARMLINGSLGNKYNATIAKLILSGKHGYVEKSEIDQKLSGEVKTGEANPELAAEFANYLKKKNS